MALIDLNNLKAAKYKDKDTGLRLDTPEGTKAIIATGQPGKPRKTRRHNQGWWPDEKKIECCTLYAAMGNYRRVAELSKIPEHTIIRWSHEDWWLQTLQKVRREENIQTDKKFSTIVDKALTKLEERIEKGDYVYDIKRGCAMPVPVSARDLTIVTGTLFDKRQLLRGEATRISQAGTSEDHLKKLADQFAAYVKAKTEEKIISSLPNEDTDANTPAITDNASTDTNQ
jgi:hypothetical protein